MGRILPSFHFLISISLANKKKKKKNIMLQVNSKSDNQIKNLTEVNQGRKGISCNAVMLFQ